ncbi:rod shape-determining protein RodA [Rapidithrix thailandica]|uniref:Cell wall polymerase n=1 Tax=Rapidithrix thailandica TaxID=413964 RepID=A0AAW9RYI4_9BACT
MREQKLSKSLDWFTILLYLTMVTLGWLNIYAAVYDVEIHKSIVNLDLNSGKQLFWIFSALLLGAIILLLDFKLFDRFAFGIYGGLVLMLIGVLFFGKEIAGSRSWFDFGFMRLQPAEFAKVAVSLAVAGFLKEPSMHAEKPKVMFSLFGFILVPAALIILQGDTGSAMVFAALVIVFYREGLPAYLMVLGLSAIALFVATLFLRESHLDYFIGGIVIVELLFLFLFRKQKKKLLITLVGFAMAIGLVLSVDYIISDIFKPHQRDRIDILIHPDKDPMGVGWQVTQSKIAIGSGGIWGKGFLEGTQTKFDFVPDQSTDFIFCTVGEEHGWLGSLIVIGLFMTLISRLITLAERQKARFSRVYGYCVASILFFHFMINIGMTIGLFPVVGIPLPFFSYGGSSLWSFTILVFIFIKLDAHRSQMLVR